MKPFAKFALLFLFCPFEGQKDKNPLAGQCYHPALDKSKKTIKVVSRILGTNIPARAGCLWCFFIDLSIHFLPRSPPGPAYAHFSKLLLQINLLSYSILLTSMVHCATARGPARWFYIRSYPGEECQCIRYNNYFSKKWLPAEIQKFNSCIWIWIRIVIEAKL